MHYFKCGRIDTETSEELGVSQKFLSRLWKPFQKDIKVSRRYNTGCARVTIPNEERYLSVTVKKSRSRRSTASDPYATRGLFATDNVILNHGQMTWTTPELAPTLLTTTPHQREDVSALDRFNVHCCPTWRVFSGTGLEFVAWQATVRYLYHSATTATITLRRALLA
ncbi:uncharacterized protein TNCV_562431 [Trichonephila clavipes]|nr:uncharacterized protein TNCV_562431 [Trichonephila clavipes]